MSLLLFIVVLIVLVLAHEFGHFIIAKAFGIRVDEFAFGFPPRLFSVKKGETAYSFNALPFGGYVKIYGENPNEVTDVDRPRSFGAKPRYVQAAVVVAGIVFNIILAWLLISSTLMIGIDAPVADGYPVTSPRLMITDLPAQSPARAAGLEPGDVIVSVSDGTESVKADSPEAVSRFIGPREGKRITVTYDRGGNEGTASMLPVSGITPTGAAIGIYMDMVGTLKLPIHKALWQGIYRTYEYTKLTAVGTFGFIRDAVIGHADLSQVKGPVGIEEAVGAAAKIGFANLLLFTSLISINLAIINILPFPALDGGRLFFIIIESITRKPIPARVANSFNFAGLALLLFLMVLVTWHDIAVKFM